MYVVKWKRRKILQRHLLQSEDHRLRIKFDMTNQKDRYRYKKLFGNKGIKRRRRQRIRKLDKFQRKIHVFFYTLTRRGKLKENSPFKMPYRTKIVVPFTMAWLENSLPVGEVTALTHYPTCRGYLYHLFRLNSFRFWDELKLSAKLNRIFTPFSMKDVLKLELARYKCGVQAPSQWLWLLRSSYPVFAACELDHERVPETDHYNKLVAQLGTKNLQNFFHQLVQECIAYNLIDFNIGIWDGRFLESYCAKNKNKQLERFSDQDAGLYKHIKKFYGVGYLDSSIIDAKYNLTIFFSVFPANRNDTIIYRRTYSNCLDRGHPNFLIMLADAGCYSKQNLDFTALCGSVPLIMAKKNIKHDVIKVATRKYINITYVPSYMKPYLLRLLNSRTKIERSFSPARVVYRTSRMQNRGYDNAVCNIAKLKIIELLTAITAVKTHRPDLINSPTAFRDLTPHWRWSTIIEKLSSLDLVSDTTLAENLLIYPKPVQTEFHPPASFESVSF